MESHPGQPYARPSCYMLNRHSHPFKAQHVLSLNTMKSSGTCRQSKCWSDSKCLCCAQGSVQRFLYWPSTQNTGCLGRVIQKPKMSSRLFPFPRAGQYCELTRNYHTGGMWNGESILLTPILNSGQRHLVHFGPLCAVHFHWIQYQAHRSPSAVPAASKPSSFLRT